jgi:hypothetical protein
VAQFCIESHEGPSVNGAVLKCLSTTVELPSYLFIIVEVCFFVGSLWLFAFMFAPRDASRQLEGRPSRTPRTSSVLPYLAHPVTPALAE